MASSSNVNKCPAFTDCKAPIDVILCSSDGKQFGAHKSYLGTYTGGFPSAEMTNNSAEPEVVELEEKADVLLLLLQFSHPERPPSTTSLQPELIIRLSEAVEKYVVYGAMEACRLRIRDIAANQPLKAFRFSIKYGDADLRNHCAPLTVDHYSVEKMRTELKGLERYFPALVAWFRLKEAISAQKKALPIGAPARGVSRAEAFETYYVEELSLSL